MESYIYYKKLLTINGSGMVITRYFFFISYLSRLALRFATKQSDLN